MTYDEWRAKYPAAAADLGQVLAPACNVGTDFSYPQSEARTQQQARLTIARQGALSWRNNVGATPGRCPGCGKAERPVRYGLANDSQKLNEQIKSSDLILAIPRRITLDMVGQTIAQFGAVECKAEDWRFTGTSHEAAQAAWLALITRAGGFATFSTGEVHLYD